MRLVNEVILDSSVPSADAYGVCVISNDAGCSEKAMAGADAVQGVIQSVMTCSVVLQ